MPLARRNCSSDIRTSSPLIKKSNGSDFHSGFTTNNHKMKLQTNYFGKKKKFIYLFNKQQKITTLPACSKLFTTEDKPKRVRLEGIAIALLGTFCGGFSFVMKRTWTRLEFSSFWSSGVSMFMSICFSVFFGFLILNGMKLICRSTDWARVLARLGF